MKAILIKDHQEYMLINGERFVIATTDASMLKVTDKMKLSKQNCDEIFGVVDVEKLAEEVFGPWTSFLDLKRGFITGYFKAKQTYKYTEIDLRKAMNFVFDRLMVVEQFEPLWINEFIQSLQQPKEIEVMIEMAEYPDLPYYKGPEPKLDSHGCLILKRVV